MKGRYLLSVLLVLGLLVRRQHAQRSLTASMRAARVEAASGLRPWYHHGVRMQT